jgi:hypothetical protein
MSIGKTTDLNLVNTAQIVDGSVTSAKIGAGAVGSAALASGAVGAAAISSGSATSGQILQANGSGAVTFETPAASGGMTLIATATLSAASTIEFSSIPSTYKDLVIKWSNFTHAGSGSNTTLRFNSDSSTTYDHTVQNFRSTYNSVTQSFSQTSMASNQYASPLPMSTGGSGAGSITIYRYADTTPKQVSWQAIAYNSAATSSSGMTIGIGIYRGTSAISTITFTTGSSYTGTMYLYGVS